MREMQALGRANHTTANPRLFGSRQNTMCNLGAPGTSAMAPSGG